MSRRLVIDGTAFAREGGSLQGELLVENLARVLDMLAGTAGNLTYRVSGRMGSGPRARPQLVVEVDGILSLRCQRCLGAIDHRFSIHSMLDLVGEGEALTQEEIEDDSKDFLEVKKELDVAELVEDEVILDLPSAPRHERCVLPAADRGTEKASPFAVLKGLRGKAQ